MGWSLSTIIIRMSSLFPTSRSRKLGLLTITLLVLLGYIGPWLLHHNNTVTVDCLVRKTKKLAVDLVQGEASIVYTDSQETHIDQVMPFVGNGKIGVVVDITKPTGLLINSDKSWINVPLYLPLVRAQCMSIDNKGTLVVNYRKATVQLYQCHAVGESCVFLQTTTIAHRVRPSLLLQEIFIDNEADETILVQFLRNGPNEWKGSTTTTEFVDVNGKRVEYLLSTGDYITQDGVISFVIAVTNFHGMVEVPARSTHTEQVLTLIRYSDSVTTSTAQLIASIVDDVEEELFRLLHSDFTELVKEHEDVWSEEIWKTNLIQEPLTMPVNPANDAVSNLLRHADMIHASNIQTTAVLYYMMSSTEASLMMSSTSAKRKKEILSALRQPGSCFNGRPTLFESALRHSVQAERDMLDLLSHWQHVLYKHGCHKLLLAGVTGLMQAAILSFLAGQFTEHELSFHADPVIFRSKIHLHNLLYNSSFLHIEIDPSPGRQQILISSSSSQTTKETATTAKLYACGAGCEGTPIVLSQSVQRLRLRWTEPQTPFLYVSHDVKHLEYLRTRIIHYKHIHDLDIAIVQALLPLSLGDHTGHKEEHHGFQMPVLVWVIVISFIVVFHCFLLNLVYREYCSASKGSGPSEKTSKA